MTPAHEGALRHASVAVIGAGLTGMACACRLAVKGTSVAVFESHRSLGGCAGSFSRSGFHFDAGSTTLVDYQPGGVGGELLATIGLPDALLEHLPAYIGWIGGRAITMHADSHRWQDERARAFGDTAEHRRFWKLTDSLARVLWRASRSGARMPLKRPGDLLAAARAVPPGDWWMLRYLRWTVDDALRMAGVASDRLLRAFVSMVVQDTVHGELATAPLANASLGLSIRAALARPRGGMHGFWCAFEQRALQLGVSIHRSTAVTGVLPSNRRTRGRFQIMTHRGSFTADAIVCTLPIWDAARIGPAAVRSALEFWCRRDAAAIGGAAMLTLGVPEEEVTGHPFTHHQFLPEPDRPLGNGNNSFLSISSPGDLASAPAGWRVAMMTTHVDVDDWMDLSPSEHAHRKELLGERLLAIARAAYPSLGQQARWRAVASPRTYARFTRRHRGSVGGTRLTLRNSNQRAVPHDIGVPGWIQAGDTTWPGIGTTACAICSRIATEHAIRSLA